MGRLDDLKVLYSTPPADSKIVTFESILPSCHIYNILTIEDIMQLNMIAKNKKLSSKPKEKLDMIKAIMENRGFKKLASGTNRIVFKYMEDQSFVIKVAYDSVGLGDNIKELYNQEFLKPFCTKVFEVSPCGTVGMFERVHTISNREEFASVASEIYDIIIHNLVGQYIIDDFGTKFFMNWGIRKGMHPVILDFPYVYELDGAKIYCNRPDFNSPMGFCGGEIDYDDGFNHLICTKCGKTFLASELKLAAEKKSKDIIIEQEDIDMIIEIKKGDKVINRIDTTKESTTYKKDKRGRKKETPLEYRERKKYQNFNVNIERTSVNIIEDETPVTDKIQSRSMPTEDQYNQNWSLDSIPTVDGMYKDLSVIIQRGKNKQTQKKVQPQTATVTEDEAKRIENIIQQNSIPDTDTDKEDLKEAINEIVQGEKILSEDLSEPDIEDNETISQMIDEIKKIAPKLSNDFENIDIDQYTDIADEYIERVGSKIINNQYERARKLVEIVPRDESSEEHTISEELLNEMQENVTEPILRHIPKELLGIDDEEESDNETNEPTDRISAEYL